MIDVKNPIEVINLMLNHPGDEPTLLQQDRLSVLVPSGQTYIVTPWDSGLQPRKRETRFSFDISFPAELNMLWVYDDDGLRRVMPGRLNTQGHVIYEDSKSHAKLWSGYTDTNARPLQHPDHLSDQLMQLAAEVSYGFGD